jgi:hypothetical protein
MMILRKRGASGCVLEVPWPWWYVDDDAWPLASPKLAVVVYEAPAPAAYPGEGHDRCSPLGGGSVLMCEAAAA